MKCIYNEVVIKRMATSSNLEHRYKLFVLYMSCVNHIQCNSHTVSGTLQRTVAALYPTPTPCVPTVQQPRILTSIRTDALNVIDYIGDSRL